MRYTGIVRDGVIALKPGTHLPEGMKVSVIPAPLLTERVAKYRENDASYEKAIASFAEAEKASDPIEGEVVDLATDSAVRDEMRKILAGG